MYSFSRKLHWWPKRVYFSYDFYTHQRDTRRVTSTLPLLDSLPPARFEEPVILKAVARAARQLAELKGVVATIPSQAMLINTLALQEAKDSSAIENIVTTQDQLFRDEASSEAQRRPAAKEVLRYRQAIRVGHDLVSASGMITNRHLLRIHSVLKLDSAGFRLLPGTTLRDGAGRIVYTPPQDAGEIRRLMRDLERFLNVDPAYPADPLIRMAIAHHRFESIHPFHDGNGRTGRILNVLYLVKEGLLDVPVLSMSRQIVRSKARYYELLQGVRESDRWEEWVLYLLDAVETTAREGIATVTAIRLAFLDLKHQIRDTHRFYSQGLVNNLFAHPYTKVQFVEHDLGISRLTATRYLDALAADGILKKRKVGRTNFYMNVRLLAILADSRRGAPT